MIIVSNENHDYSFSNEGDYRGVVTGRGPEPEISYPSSLNGIKDAILSGASSFNGFRIVRFEFTQNHKGHNVEALVEGKNVLALIEDVLSPDLASITVIDNLHSHLSGWMTTITSDQVIYVDPVKIS